MRVFALLWSYSIIIDLICYFIRPVVMVTRPPPGAFDPTRSLQNSLAAEESRGLSAGARSLRRPPLDARHDDLTQAGYRCAAAVSVEDLRAGARV